MKALRVKCTNASFAVALFAGAALTFSLVSGASPAWAFSEHRGKLQATKDCSEWTGKAGSFCTITASNFGPLKVNSKVYYTQEAGIPAGMLDSNVVLDAGSGDRAFGRCSVEIATGAGLCTFSDGTGQFAGFEARLDVAFMGGKSFTWDGTYSFSREHGRD